MAEYLQGKLVGGEFTEAVEDTLLEEARWYAESRLRPLETPVRPGLMQSFVHRGHVERLSEVIGLPEDDQLALLEYALESESLRQGIV